MTMRTNRQAFVRCGAWLATLLVLGPAIGAPPSADPPARETKETGGLLGMMALTITRVSSRNAAPIFRALLRRDQAELDAILAERPDLQVRTEEGITALQAAIPLGRGSPAMALALVQAGADPNFPDARGGTPLLYALVRNQPAIVGRLLAGGARLDRITGDGRSAVAVAVEAGRFELLPMMLSAGANGLEQLPEGRPIHYVARYRQPTIIHQLLCLGENIDSQNAPGRRTPLMLAARQGGVSTLRAVLEFHPKLDLQDEKGWTALMHAIVADQPNVAQLLLEQNADAKIAAADGITAYILAGQRGFVELERALVERGAAEADVQLPVEAGRLADLTRGHRRALALAGFELHANGFAFGVLQDEAESSRPARAWLTRHRLSDRGVLLAALDALQADDPAEAPTDSAMAGVGALSEEEFRAKIEAKLDDPAAIVALKRARQSAPGAADAEKTAWECCHHNFLVVLGVRAGLLREAEGWLRMGEASRRLRATGIAWPQVGTVLSRRLASAELSAPRLEALKRLFLASTSPASPWLAAPLTER